VRRVAALASALLLAASLTSCGHGTKSYCSALRGDQGRLKKLARETARHDAKGAEALGDTVGLLTQLQDKAPDEVAEDWRTLVQALRGLDQAVRESGAAPAGFGSGRRPKGVTEGQYAAVQQAAEKLQSTPVQQASASIEQHALQVCKVDLGSGLGGAG
jgi:hypothetical protein